MSRTVAYTVQPSQKRDLTTCSIFASDWMVCRKVQTVSGIVWLFMQDDYTFIALICLESSVKEGSPLISLNTEIQLNGLMQLYHLVWSRPALYEKQLVIWHYENKTELENWIYIIYLANLKLVIKSSNSNSKLSSKSWISTQQILLSLNVLKTHFQHTFLQCFFILI